MDELKYEYGQLDLVETILTNNYEILENVPEVIFKKIYKCLKTFGK